MKRRKAITVILAAGAASLSAGSEVFSAEPQTPAAPPKPELADAFAYGGRIVDVAGAPIEGVEITATHHYADSHGFSYIDVVRSDAQGRFRIDRARAISGELPATLSEGAVQIVFRHSDYAIVTLFNLQRLSRDEATNLTSTLYAGRSISGQVVDDTHQPVAGALVEISFPSDDAQRRGLSTDASGRFAFHGLPEEDGTIHALTVAGAQPALTGRRETKSTDSEIGAIELQRINLPPRALIHELFGMNLVDVDAQLQAAFHLQRAGGVLVLDPGTNGLGLNLQRGDQFWIVGDEPIGDFADFTARLLALSQVSPAENSRPGTVRVVYCFSRPEFKGTNTQHIALSPEDITELSKFAEISNA